MTSSASSLQPSIIIKPYDSNYVPSNLKHPKYLHYEARHKSFVGWPGRYVPKTPEELSKAGFFYIGSADRVTCFQCGITLRDWEAEHDPFKEHAKHSKNCDFIKHIVQNCANSKTKVTNSNQGENNETSTDSISRSECQSSRHDSEEQKKVKVTQSNENGNDIQMDKLTISNPKSKRLASLLDENKRLKEESICRLCGVEPSSILFLPCGHLVTCPGCAKTVAECNSCGKTILGTVKTYRG